MILNISASDFNVSLLVSDKSYDFFYKEFSHIFDINIASELIRINSIQSSWLIVVESEWIRHNTLNNDFENIYEKVRINEPIKKFMVNLKKKIVVIAEPSDDNWRHHIVIRVVRDMYRIYLIQNGGVPLHGGMIEKDGIGIAVLGRKKTGKTTTLLSMMDSSTNFIANDDLIISYYDDIKGHGSTRTISIRKDTLKYISCIPVEYTASNPLNETKLNENYLFLKPIELFSNNIKFEANICLFIFPTFNSTIEGRKISMLNNQQLLLELNANIEDTRYSYFPNVLKRMFPYVNLSDKYSCILRRIVNSNKVKGIKVEQNIESMINFEILLSEEII